MQRFDHEIDVAFEQSEQDSDLTPFVQTVRRWWGEASALRDPARASQVTGNLPA